jgi:hypothetical protein
LTVIPACLESFLKKDAGQASVTEHFRNLTLLMVLLLAIHLTYHAGIAQLVEHNLAKVGVAGSNPVSRSILIANSR